MGMLKGDAICAIATAAGEGGIAIVRMSGEGAREIFQQIFRPAKAQEILSHRMMYGWATDANGEALDEVMAVFLAGPGTYTREDMFESQCHGGGVCARRIIDRLIDLGCRIAAPGEFSSPFYFSFPSGSAGLIGTLRDYDRFVQMLGNGGELDGVRLLKEETVRLMAASCPEDPPKALPGSAWGLGMNIFSAYPISHRHLSEGTFGWSGAFGTHFYIDPTNDVTMVLMLNRSDIGGADSYVSFGMEEAIFKGLGLR